MARLADVLRLAEIGQTAVESAKRAAVDDAAAKLATDELLLNTIEKMATVAREANAEEQMATLRKISMLSQARPPKAKRRECESRVRIIPRPGRARRLSSNTRQRGSRRVSSRSAGGGSSGDPDSDEPALGRRHSGAAR